MENINDFCDKTLSELDNYPIPNKLYMHQKAVTLKSPLKLMGKPVHDVYRIKHSKLRYSHIPIDFLSINVEAKDPSEYYIVQPKFRFMTNADITCLCTYFGIFNKSETKCRHPMCINTHTYLFNSVEQFIIECNYGQKKTKKDSAFTFFPLPDFDLNSKLCSKISGIFWFESMKDTSIIKIVGNARIPKGASCFPLISTISENKDYEVKQNIVDNINYPQIISVKIIHNKLYFNCYEGVSVNHEKQVGIVVNISLDTVPITDLKCIGFEIFNFKNSNWPVRAITDKIISFFMKTKGIAIELHWSFTIPIIRNYWIDFKKTKHFSDSKSAFISFLKGFVDEKTLKEIQWTLNGSRTFWFLVPASFDHIYSVQQIKLLLDSMSTSRTLQFQAELIQFELFRDVDDIIGIEEFFKTDMILKGEMSLVLFKPNFQFLNNYQEFERIVGHYAQIIEFKVVPIIEDRQFNGLYDNCLSRPYGIAWKNYMQSGPVVACLMMSPDVKILRQKIIELRRESRVVWIKNIAHASADKVEAVRDIGLFFDTQNFEMIYETNSTYLPKLSSDIEESFEEEDDLTSVDDFSSLDNLKTNPFFISFVKYMSDQNVSKRSKKD